MHRTMRDSWPRICFLRKVAFMGDTHYLFHQSERGRDLGCSRQKRNDPNHFLLYAVSCYEDRKEPEQETEKRRGERVSYKTPTACEISRTTMVREIKIWTIARIFAQRASNGESVGPKVELCVNATNR